MPGWFHEGRFEVLRHSAAVGTSLQDDDIRVILMRETYNALFLAEAHTNLAHADIAANEATPTGTHRQVLISKVITRVASTGARMTAANSVFPSVVAQAAVDAVIMYRNTGVDATSPVITWNDFVTLVNPNGSDITVQYSAQGIAEIQ